MTKREGLFVEAGEAFGQGTAALRGHPLRTALGMLAIHVGADPAVTIGEIERLLG